MNSQIQKTSEYFILLNEKITELDDVFSICKTTLKKTNQEIEALNKHFTGTIKLESAIKQNIDLLNECTPTLYSTSYQVRQILNETEKLISTYDSSPATKIKKIENISEEILHLLDEIESNISGLKSNISDIKSDVYWARSDISNVQSNVSDVKYDVSQARSDISDIKSSIS